MHATPEILAGSVCSGSLHPAHVIPPCAAMLEYLHDNFDPFRTPSVDYRETTTSARSLIHRHEAAANDEANTIMEDLFAGLSDFAPDGLFFGAHPNDGACFGFWREEEA